MENLTINCFQKIFEAKVFGTKNLLELALKFNVKYFIAVSSVVTNFGYIGQVNYAVANAIMSKYCAKYKKKNINIIIRGLGPFSDVGMLANNDALKIKKQIIDSGWNFINIEDASNFIASNFKSKSYNNCFLFNANWSFFIEQQPHLKNFIKNVFNQLIVNEKKIQSKTKNALSLSTKNFINDYFLDDNKIKKEIQRLINVVSGINNIEYNIGFMSVGLDSITIEDLRNKLNEKFNVNLNITEMYEFVNINELCKLIKNKLNIQYNDKTNKIINSTNFLSDNNLYNIKTLKNCSTNKIEKETFEINNNKEQKFKNKNILQLSTKVLDINYYKTFIKKNDIAIIGISGSFSGVNTIEELWSNILKKKELFTTNFDENKFTDFFNTTNKTFIPVSGVVPETNSFDKNLFSLSIEDIKILDPQIRISLLHAYLALEKSGYLRKKKSIKIGCFIGAEPSSFLENSYNNETSIRGSINKMYYKNQKDFIAMWISYLLNLKGPSMAVYSACSSSLSAIEQASKTILLNKADICLAGAVHLIPINDIGHDFIPGTVLSSTKNCRPFTQNKNGGIIRGSGCSIAVLKLAINALNDQDNILGIIKSCAINNDGGILNKSNFMAPSVIGQTNVMLDAFKQAENIQPIDVEYLEAHATGTYVGDEIETKAISNVYFSKSNNKSLFVGSIKANIGHTFAASGMASLAKLLKILDTKLIPPQLDTLTTSKTESTKNDKIKIFFGNSPKKIALNKNHKPIYVALNNFGIGGTNASAILMEGPKRFIENKKLKTINNDIKSLINNNYYIIPLSGASIKSCLNNCKVISIYCSNKLKEFENFNNINKEIYESNILKSIAFTLQNCRKHYSFRFCIIITSILSLINKLNALTEEDIIKAQNNPKSALFFCPQGVQYSEMLKTELKHSKYLQKCLNKYCNLYTIKSHNLKQILSSDTINNVEFTQCALFAICCTITKFINKVVQLNNEILFGHSVGEYTALVQAQMLNKKKCMDLLAIRGHLIKKFLNLFIKFYNFILKLFSKKIYTIKY